MKKTQELGYGWEKKKIGSARRPCHGHVASAASARFHGWPQSAAHYGLRCRSYNYIPGTPLNKPTGALRRYKYQGFQVLLLAKGDLADGWPLESLDPQQTDGTLTLHLQNPYSLRNSISPAHCACNENIAQFVQAQSHRS